MVRQWQPSHSKHLVVTGWEPLGIAGTVVERKLDGTYVSTHGIKNNFECKGLGEYLADGKSTQPTSESKIDKWCGGYGMASFSLNTLKLRAERGLATFSLDLSHYTHIMFLGVSYLAVPTPEVDYILHFDQHFSISPTDYTNLKKWTHPLHMLLKKGHVLVQSLQRYPRGKWRKVKRRPPPEVGKQWFEKEQFSKFLLTNYRWSTVQLRNPFGVPGSDLTGDNKIPFENTWLSNKRPCWYDRESYDTGFLNWDKSSWFNKWWTGNLTTSSKGKYSPFCPPMYDAKNLNCMYFFYKFHFKVAGSAYDSVQPGDLDNEVSRTPDCGRQCRYCIRPDDLDKHGFIKSKRFRELVESNYPNRLGLLHAFPNKRRKKKEKKVSWGPTEYLEEKQAEEPPVYRPVQF